MSDPTTKKEKKKKEPKAVAPSKENPEYIAHRIEMFDQLKLAYDERIASMPRESITITLQDGKVLTGTSYETTPLEIAKGLSKSLSERVVIAKVDGELYDLTRVLEKSCRLQLLDFESDDGKKVFWHSSAHVLGEACELHYGCHLCIGPPIEEGYFYEMAMENPVKPEDYQALDSLSKKAVTEKQEFVRLEMTKQELLEMFKHNKYKLHIINDKVDDDVKTTVYRCGPLIDLCYGPHIPHTGKIKAMKIVKNSSSYFLGDAENDSLQRIYGVSFPEAKLMKEYEIFMEEAAKRNHRKIGIEQNLFFFNDLSPGSAFWLPHGTRIYNSLVELQREEYRKRGYQEVVTPNMYNKKLFETSGHWANYKDDMFTLEVDKETYALKPMNCPGHCVVFGHQARSYKELPIRMADFGVLHRNEASGALSGLFRVRRFQQDDAHIFCRMDQLREEMDGCLEFLSNIYTMFGFTFFLKLSTRPDKFLGDIETWDKAEELLREALVKFDNPWELNPGDGAFYGPKIDIVISDALKRKHQCATIQLDFQQPERFKLEYSTGDSENPTARPVMIHRAILGTIERLTGILTESFAGKWPFWLSPRQVIVIPIAAAYNAYAKEVSQKFHDAGLYSECDLSDNTFKKKVRNAEIIQANFIFVVGQDEMDSGSVNARNRDDPASKGRGEVRNVDEILAKLVVLKQTRDLNQLI